jgi:hypothetical protein
MKTRKTVAIALPLVVAASLAAVVMARNDEPRIGHADLSGFEENLTLSTPGSGTLDVAISRDEDSLRYRLHYEGLVTTVQQAHIHLGRPAINGGIMVFFCTNLTAPAGVPAPQPCPQGQGTITGILTEADIVGPGAQGICPPLPTTPPCVSQTSETRFSQLIEALRAEAAYGNVHTMAFPGGEVRGQIHFDKGHKGRGN